MNVNKREVSFPQHWYILLASNLWWCIFLHSTEHLHQAKKLRQKYTNRISIMIDMNIYWRRFWFALCLVGFTWQAREIYVSFASGELGVFLTIFPKRILSLLLANSKSMKFNWFQLPAATSNSKLARLLERNTSDVLFRQLELWACGYGWCSSQRVYSATLVSELQIGTPR